MMFNKFLDFSQKKLNFLYENSIFLQKIDNFILPLILLVFIVSTFMLSDYIGFIALVIIFLTLIKLFTKPDEKITFSALDLIILVYFLIITVSLFGSTLFAQSLKGFLKTFIYIGFYFSTVQYLKDNKSKIPLILGTVALCISAEAILGIFQSTLHLEQISTWQDTSRLNPEDVLSRVYGSLQPFNPNLYGGYLVGGLPVIIGAVFYFLNKKHYKFVITSLALTFATIYAIFQTGCRGAYMAMMLVFVACFIISAKFFWKKYKKIYTAIISTATMLFIFVITFINSVRLRFLSIFAMREDSSNSFRFNVYHSSLEMFRDNWLLGIGVGNKNFREIYGLYMKTGFDALSSYNIYLETAVESGIFALIAFLTFLIKVSYDGIRKILTSDNNEIIIITSSCIISIWAMMLHGMVDTVYFRPQIQFIFWTNMAILNTYIAENKEV